MNIKERIGKRIAESRKKRGLTLRGLAELSGGELTSSCVANWERGTRTPGPKEALLLGELLNVAASYLLGLSDNEQGQIVLKEPEFKVVPLLSDEQAVDPIGSINTLRENTPDNMQYAPLAVALQNKVHPHCFALEIGDESMSPRLMVSDIVVVDPEQKPKPGNLVVAFVGGQGIIVRQYKQRGVNQSFESFELVAVNSNWANIIVDQPEIAKIIGVVCQSMHVYH